MWLVATILGSAAVDKAGFYFFPLAGGHRDGALGSFRSDSSELSTSEEEGVGFRGLSTAQERLCIHRRFLSTTCTHL